MDEVDTEVVLRLPFPLFEYPQLKRVTFHPDRNFSFNDQLYPASRFQLRRQSVETRRLCAWLVFRRQFHIPPNACIQSMTPRGRRLHSNGHRVLYETGELNMPQRRSDMRSTL